MTERILLALCVLAAVGLLTIAVRAPCGAEAWPTPYLVRRVIDGDTFEVEDPWGLRTKIRLRRTNAPELDEPGGPEAKAALEAQLLGRRIGLTIYARDRWGRIIAVPESVSREDTAQILSALVGSKARVGYAVSAAV